MVAARLICPRWYGVSTAKRTRMSHTSRGLANNRVSDTILQTLARFGEERMRDVAIPAVGFAMTEAVLQRWLKQPGESVDEGEPVAEIETDKTTAELESP